jgi:hypothetical protein
MEMKGAGQEGMENCLGKGQGPNWTVQPLVVVVVTSSLLDLNILLCTLF